MKLDSVRTMDSRFRCAFHRLPIVFVALVAMFCLGLAVSIGATTRELPALGTAAAVAAQVSLLDVSRGVAGCDAATPELEDHGCDDPLSLPRHPVFMLSDLDHDMPGGPRAAMRSRPHGTALRPPDA